MAEREKVSDLARQRAHDFFRVLPRLSQGLAALLADAYDSRDLSARQFAVIFLIHNESSSPTYLARRLDVTPAVITGLVDRLERRGYARREPDPTDRRRVRLVLTEAGYETYRTVWGRLEGAFSAGLAAATPEALIELGRALELLDEAITRSLPGGRTPRVISTEQMSPSAR